MRVQVYLRLSDLQKSLKRNYWSNGNSLIEAEKLAVFMVDECHLLWGDLLSYAWGRKHKRIDIPIQNERERQTYYGAYYYQTNKFIVQELKKCKY